MPPSLSDQEIVELAERVRAHSQLGPLASLAYDLFLRQGHGKQLYAGGDFVSGRIEAHKVDRANARFGAIDFLHVLEKGPVSGEERALSVALALVGFDRALGSATQPENLATRFVAATDWFEISTPYEVYRLVPEMVSEPSARSIWNALSDSVVASFDETPAGRARDAARLASLAAAPESASPAREAVLNAAPSPSVRAMARALIDPSSVSMEMPEDPAGMSVRGWAYRPPRSRFTALLRVVSGWSLLSMLIRGFGALVQVRDNGVLRLMDNAVVFEREFTMFGRLIKASRETITLRAVGGVVRERKYPLVYLFLGLAALCLGIVLGGSFVFDGVRGGDTIALLLGALFIGLGAAADLVLYTLLPGKRGKVRIDVQALSGPGFGLEGVAIDEADAFTAELARRLRVG